MRNPQRVFWLAALVVVGLAPAVAEGQQGQGQAVVTVMPKKGNEVPANVTKPDMSIKVNGKTAKVTAWTPYQGERGNVELVLLLDSGARTSLGRQMDDMASFLKALPPNVKAAVGYMTNGRSALAGPLSTDRAVVLKELHLPLGAPGSDASPYFCLSDLARNWPSRDPEARREVVMVSDGVDYYQMRYDPEDPYVIKAIDDAVRARLVVYSIYWMNQGRADRASYENNAGQNLLTQVTEATGGRNFWEGVGNPVSFQPYFEELTRRLRNQYELRFTSQLSGKPEIETLKVKLSAPGTEVDAPGQVLVAPAGQKE